MSESIPYEEYRKLAKKANRRAYYHKHREEALAYQKAWYEAHKEEAKAYFRAYYQARKGEDGPEH